MGDSSSRERKVRGRKIRADRSQKKRRKAKKKAKNEFDRTANGTKSEAKSGGGDSILSSPDEVAPDPFVETDAVTSLRDRIAGWLEADQPVHLIGPTGCGKTALALSAAAARDRPVVWLNGDEAVGTAELVGTHAGGERYEEHDQFVSGVNKKTQVVRERWVDNPLSVAVKEGATLVYNEFSRSDPAAHNVLLSVLEEGVLERPGKRGADRTVDVHPEFRLLVTSNDVEYAGVHEQQDALLDRFVGVHVDYYDEETEREIAAAHVDVPDETVAEIVDATRRLRDELDIVVGTRAAITVAEGLTIFAEDGTGEFDDELLADVFTDVLAPKLAGEDDEIGDLREAIRNAL
ncbi:gas vesicle protein GvpN [Natronococcus wangiae]|uniref:gas vesicle protein GvpN n=1 Tax=Natronococcus wangiae TaxID=3068275 RepID=UPI00273DC712|nr:gas vesicle protein GvpN [Natronococcus sp. AD5]